MAIILSEAFAAAGYSGCAASPFGSTVSGLGFVGCDLDIYLDLGQPSYRWRPTHHQQPQQQQHLLTSVPVTMTEAQKVKLAAQVLREGWRSY